MVEVYLGSTFWSLDQTVIYKPDVSHVTRRQIVLHFLLVLFVDVVFAVQFLQLFRIFRKWRYLLHRTYLLFGLLIIFVNDCLSDQVINLRL